MNGWNDQPHTFDRDMWARFIAQLEQSEDNPVRGPSNPIYFVLLAFQATRPWTDELSVEESAASIRRLLVRRGTSDAPWLDTAADELVIAWQADAAWAILNDQPIPPLTSESSST
jgi:hypothetical protein